MVILTVCAAALAATGLALARTRQRLNRIRAAHWG